MDRVSGRKYGTDKRIPTESRPAAFYNKKQFRYFDTLDNIPFASQVVYKAIITGELELVHRDLSLWAGGREYLVYKDSPSITFTGTLQDSGIIANLNQIGGNVPTETVVIQRAVGANILTIGVNDKPFVGTAILTDGNTNRASSVYTPDSLRLGLSDTTVWLVLNPIGANSPTHGQLILAYEEV